ncbi:MAG: preprotein translocase subunit SecE [Deltaproteobacteria bacterium]|nr:preprotein translocase subunit SecE [Deltaproteobacteria bacterium]
MKTSKKKRGKRGTRKKAHSGSEPKIALKQDLGLPQKEQETKPVTFQAVTKKAPEKRRDDKSSLFRYVNIATQFLKEAKMELKKVKWPTRKELLASTAIVIFFVLVIAFFLGLIDFGLIKIIKKIVG